MLRHLELRRPSNYENWQAPRQSHEDWVDDSFHQTMVMDPSLRPLERKLRGIAVEDMPPNIEAINAEIEESRSMLEWADNFDEEGSPHYERETWNRAVEFVMSNVSQLWRYFGRSTSAAQILPGPQGSIDIHWQTPSRELYVNIPVDANEHIQYYGTSIAGTTLNGTIAPSEKKVWLLYWMTE